MNIFPMKCCMQLQMHPWSICRFGLAQPHMYIFMRANGEG